MEISKDQANKIAYFVFENLDEYINSHYDEFQKFLEEIKRGNDKNEKQKNNSLITRSTKSNVG